MGSKCIALISVHLGRGRHGRMKQKGALELLWTYIYCIMHFGEARWHLGLEGVETC